MNIENNTNLVCNDTQSKILQSIFEDQRQTYMIQRYPSYQDRVDNLEILYHLIEDNSEEIRTALNNDFGCRSAHETDIAEIIGSLSSIRYQIKNLRRFMRPIRRRTSIWFMPASGKVHMQPLGVVGVMAPWNYSVHLTIAPIAAALAAGNRVMAKMSELTPHTSALLKRLVAERFPLNTLAIIEGEADVAQAFSSLPFDHLLFTGSTSVGKKIAVATAKNLTPTTLELSGKSPVIIDKDYDIEEAARRTLWGKIFNAGQTCIAPDYILVHKDKLIEFVRAARKIIKEFYPLGIDNGDYTSVINRQNFLRLKSLLENAESHGCEVIELIESFEDKNKLAPTLIIQPPDTADIFNEELFGPALPVFTYDDIDNAIKQIDNHPDPLALYVFSNKRTQIQYIIQRIRAGSVLINDTLLQYLQNDLPFGGVGKSGSGKYHGREGFEAFSNKQSVLHQKGIGTFTGVKLLYPPYSNLTNLMKLLIKKWP